MYVCIYIFFIAPVVVSRHEPQRQPERHCHQRKRRPQVDTQQSPPPPPSVSTAAPPQQSRETRAPTGERGYYIVGGYATVGEGYDAVGG